MKLEINTDALGRDTDRLREQLTGLRRDLDSLTASIEALDQTWEGTAREAYMVQYQSDRQNMENLCSTLEEYIRLLESAKTQYLDGDSKVKMAVAQIRI